MDPLVEQQIRASFVNCSKGEARRVNLPRDLSELPWPDLDFLGWRDPGAPDRAYLVNPGDDGELVGVTLRIAGRTRRDLMRSSLCSICVTSHSGGGVDLLAAPLAGPAGRQGNTVATYMCADLACSLYMRGKKKSALAQRIEESLTLDEQVARTRRNLNAFLAKVTG
ncbi:FBP C-terminal treble-clef zinc-finger [Streptomyces sp. DvalAA-14]|uniref:FBP domain-containing protein n=1 Tax=unclassified Streptomyces TaxID=2593676 RepID=UPI00081B91E0|nr:MULTISPECIES: FBP domain-containing protein [unclassified Streptomyces]MYS20695.1 FBP domain-containing protein [Streptomyces sp. SID4948]SCD74915.1 FBP C-terminal treble-clef zinc-finger [Streptomyces sp. DvalAA-14]